MTPTVCSGDAKMIFRANTTITVYSSATTTDSWGDPIDSDVIIATGVPASITETGNTAYSEVTTQPRVIRTATCRVSRSHADIIGDNNRIKDEKTNDTWVILSVTLPNNAVGHVPVRIEMQRSS